MKVYETFLTANTIRGGSIHPALRAKRMKPVIIKLRAFRGRTRIATGGAAVCSLSYTSHRKFDLNAERDSGKSSISGGQNSE
jgi:hypothetical protein